MSLTDGLTEINSLVSIRMLTIEGSFMTASIFRQLEIVDAYEETGHLAPIKFWGLVREPINQTNVYTEWAVGTRQSKLVRCEIHCNAIGLETAESNLKLSHERYVWWKMAGEHRKTGDFSWEVNNRPYNTAEWHERHGIRYEEEIQRDTQKIEQVKNALISKQTLLDLPQIFLSF